MTATAPSSRAPESASRPEALPWIAGVAPAERRAIVVGASSGIGAAITRQLAGEGYVVAALARRSAELEVLAREAAGGPGRILPRVHDVRCSEEVPELFEELVRELGGLDLLVYATGVMEPVGPDEYDTAKDLNALSVNLAGAIAWSNPAANLFRTQRRGTLIGVSSIAGDRGRRGNPAYATSKAAMDTFLEALRNRLGEYGVHVLTAKPGYVDTAMTRGLEGLFWVISPEEAARQVLAAARNRINVRYVPLRWMLVGRVLRCIPSFLFRRLRV